MRKLQEGDLLADKYRIGREIGSGGMGYVVSATHVHLGQTVAIKLINGARLDDNQWVERFMREARACALLRSEHVARVFDVDLLKEGGAYMVMELLVGSDLSELSHRRGPLPVEESCAYMLQACEAMAEAHSVGIVHRDLKCANLFVTQRAGAKPWLKVLDFGVSKANEITSGESTTAGVTLTKETMFLGSPQYMAPEQIRSPKGVDHRADIWSLGVVLYRILSGRQPFSGASPLAVCTDVMTSEPTSLLEIRPNLPEKLVRVVERCLEKEPAKRFNSDEDLAIALAPFAGAQGPISLAAIAAQLRETPGLAKTVRNLPVVGPEPLPPSGEAPSTEREGDAPTGHPEATGVETLSLGTVTQKERAPRTTNASTLIVPLFGAPPPPPPLTEAASVSPWSQTAAMKAPRPWAAMVVASVLVLAVGFVSFSLGRQRQSAEPDVPVVPSVATEPTPPVSPPPRNEPVPAVVIPSAAPPASIATPPPRAPPPRPPIRGSHPSVVAPPASAPVVRGGVPAVRD